MGRGTGSQRRPAKGRGGARRKAPATRGLDEHVRAIFATMSDGVLLEDAATGVVLFSNAAAERILSRSREQLLGQRVTSLASGPLTEDGRSFPPEERPSEVVRRSGQPVHGVVVGLPTASGAVTWLLVNAEPVRGPEGQLTAVVSTFSDLTERKQAEAALRASQARLAEVLEAGTDGYWERDLAEKTMFQSARMQEILGREAVDRLERVDTLFSLVHPDDLAELRALLVGLIDRAQLGFESEVRVQRADGSWRWVSCRGKAVARDADGRPLRLAGTITDIHPHKVAEQALVASERRYRDLAALSPVPIFINRDDRVDLVNQAALELWGAEHEHQLLGHSVFELFHPEARGQVSERLKRTFAGSRLPRADLRIVRLDGSVRVVEIVGAPFLDDRGLAIQVVLRDVTDERQAIAEVRANEQRYRSLAERAPAGVFEANRGGVLTYLNRALATLLGGFVPRAWFELVHPDDRARVQDAWAGLLDGTLTSEYRLLREDGTAVLVRADVSAVRDLAGRPTGYTGVVVDISERQAQLERFNVNARLAALGTFVAGVAHEVNNPLAAVVSSQEWVLEELRALQAGKRVAQGPFLADLLRALEDSREGTTRITGIVRDLARLGRTDQRRARVRLGEVVQQVVTWLPSFMTEGAVIEVRGAAPDVLASPSQLAQVLVNLLTNAAQAIPLGRSGRILVTLGPGEPGRASLEVSDDGVGITPDVMTRIFDPFFTTRDVRAGMGLGLAVVHAIVTANEGTITATSEPGQGTTFRLQLPVYPETALGPVPDGS